MGRAWPRSGACAGLGSQSCCSRPRRTWPESPVCVFGERRGLPPGPRTAGLREASDRRFLMREPAQLRTCFFASQAVVPGNFSLFIREDSSLTVHFAGRG